MSDELHDPRPLHDGPGPLWHDETSALARWNRATAWCRLMANVGDPVVIADAKAVRAEWSEDDYR